MVNGFDVKLQLWNMSTLERIPDGTYSWNCHVVQCGES